MKTAILAVFVIFGLTAPAWARLGETGDQIVARYGQPLSQVNQKAEGTRIALIFLTFQKNGFEIRVSLSDGISGAESFRKINGDELSTVEIRTLLGLNSQGMEWEAPQTTDGKTRWMRDDSSMATETGGRVFYVESKDLIMKEAAAKNMKGTPSLQGF
jgi:hypothetical protein